MKTKEQGFLTQGHLDKRSERGKSYVLFVKVQINKDAMHASIAYLVRKEGLDHGRVVQPRWAQRGGREALFPLGEAWLVPSLLQEGPLQLADVGLVFHQHVRPVVRVLIETTERADVVKPTLG